VIGPQTAIADCSLRFPSATTLALVIPLHCDEDTSSQSFMNDFTRLVRFIQLSTDYINLSLAKLLELLFHMPHPKTNSLTVLVWYLRVTKSPKSLSTIRTHWQFHRSLSSGRISRYSHIKLWSQIHQTIFVIGKIRQTMSSHLTAPLWCTKRDAQRFTDYHRLFSWRWFRSQFCSVFVAVVPIHSSEATHRSHLIDSINTIIQTRSAL
jgi:hypothetical protein